MGRTEALVDHTDRQTDESARRAREAGARPARARGAREESAPLVAPEVWQDAEELRWAARHWASRMGVKTPAIQVRPMRTKWASISTAGRMTLSAELLATPKELGEFVIVHELVHLLAPNHGPVFKLFMHAYLPDWQQRERALDRFGREQAKREAKRAARGRKPRASVTQR